MNRKLLLALLAGALLLTTVFGVALAQGTNPPAPDDEYQYGQRSPFPWGGRGMFGGMMGRLFGDTDDDASGMMGGSGLFGANGEGWQVYDAVAAALKLTPTQLFEQLHSGKTLAEIADAQGVALTDVTTAAQTAMRDAMKARIEQAVKEGRLTQAQADQMLKALEQGNMGGGMMGRGMMGRGGFFRNWRGLPFSGGQQQTPGSSF